MGAMPVEYANDHDRQLAGRYESRESDWRNGAVVYQLIVDPFSPRARLAAKAGLPVIALGGMNRHRARVLKPAGWAAIDGLSTYATRLKREDS